mgnify:CR=1 FL=1
MQNDEIRTAFKKFANKRILDYLAAHETRTKTPPCCQSRHEN